MGTGVLGAMVPYEGGLREEDIERINKIPPGLVGTLTHYLGRYREFDVALQMVWVPPNSEKKYFLGVDIAANLNTMVEALMENPKWEWLWMLGDDHVFTNDLFLKLYERDVDIVVPLCLRRDGFTPVLNYGEKEGCKSIQNSWEPLIGKSGLLKWEGTCGNAGMLVRRKVFKKLELPCFRAGQLSPKFSSVDLYFSLMAQKAGFDIYIDLDNTIGHIEHMAIWPARLPDGSWQVEIRQATAK